jgi:hypothetical protein
VPQSFCLDTSFFINGWQKHYRIEVFPTLWSTLDALIGSGQICSCHEVFLDLEKQDDELFQWAKDRRQIFHQPSENTIGEVSKIMPRFTTYSANGGTASRSDPWVIAHAIIVGAVVVTDEISKPNQRKTLPPQMPDVCDVLGLAWMRPVDFLQRVGISL